MIGLFAAGAIGAGTIYGQTPATGPDAASVLAAAREALGGEKRLSSVKSFMATGRTRQIRGDNLVPIEFEIACELPDKYVRKDEIPAQESGPTAVGFSGDDLIQFPEPAAPPARPAAPGAPPGPAPAAQMEMMRKARVATAKQDFARLTLGMFAGSFAAYPLTFTYVGVAEAPQGRADVIDVKGPANFSLRLFVNSQTHLPIMVSWQAPAAGQRQGTPGAPPGTGGGPARSGTLAAPQPGAPGAAGSGGERGASGSAPASGQTTPPAAAPPAGTAAGAPPAATPPAGTAAGTSQVATPPAGARGGVSPAAPASQGRGPGGPALVEYRIYFGDYRDVDGLQWPFRLRRATGPDTTEETTFDRFRINPKIDPKRFEVRK
jgi:hypothetical protein